MDKPRVYIVQDDGSKDLSAILKITDDVEVVCTRPFPIFGDSTNYVQGIRIKMSAIKESDYILLIGDPINIGICTHYALKKVESIQVLRWDRESREYHSITINRPENES